MTQLTCKGTDYGNCQSSWLYEVTMRQELETTIAFYDEKYAESTAHLDMHQFYDRFEKYLPEGASVLDAGCGSGRDSKHFIERGYTVTAFDASETMCKCASKLIGQEVRKLTFQEMDYHDCFDGIWACASLLHVPEEQLMTVLSNLFLSLRNGGVLYDKNQIIGIDWDSYNTDVTVEFVKKGVKTRKGKNSIQDSLREILLENPKNKYILYDHGSGEMADYVVIQEETNQWIVKLYHVKKKSAAGYNNSMNDVYEVAGQAVKSIIWLSSTGKLIDKIRSRQSSSHCIPIRGDAKELLKNLRSATK